MAWNSERKEFLSSGWAEPELLEFETHRTLPTTGCPIIAQGAAAAWLRHETIPLLSRKADTWVLPPLPFAKLINLSLSIHLSNFIVLFSAQLSAKLPSFFQTWSNWSTDQTPVAKDRLANEQPTQSCQQKLLQASEPQAANAVSNRLMEINLVTKMGGHDKSSCWSWSSFNERIKDSSGYREGGKRIMTLSSG